MTSDPFDALVADLERDPAIKPNIGLVVESAIRSLKGFGRERMADHAKDAIMYTLKNFDAKRGKFSTLLYLSMFQQYGKATRSIRRQSKHEPFDLVAAHNVPAKVPRPDARLDVETMLRSLPPRWRIVIEMRFLRGETLATVGASLGICEERVRQIEGQALRRMRGAAA